MHGDGFESYALGSDTLCDHHTNYNYRCLRGMDKGQDGAPFPTVVSAPEPVRSGKHSLRSGPFTYEEGYRVEVIPKNKSEHSEGAIIEGFGVPAWYGFSVFLPSNYSADELTSPDRIFQWHGDNSYPNGTAYRCFLNPVLTFEVLGDKMTLVQKMNQLGYRSPRTANGSTALPAFVGEGSPCGPDPPPHSCNTQAGHCISHGTLDQFLHGWYSNTSCAILGDLARWRNGWTDVVVRAVWNYNDSTVPPLPSDGQLSVWINGSKIFDRNGSNCFNDFGAPFAKFGVYKYPWKTNPSPSSPQGARVGPNVKSRLAYHDEVYECRGEGCNYDMVQAKPVLHQRIDEPVAVLPTCAT